MAKHSQRNALDIERTEIKHYHAQRSTYVHREINDPALRSGLCLPPARPTADKHRLLIQETFFMSYPTTDLCDQHARELQIAEPMFIDFGGQIDFGGPLSTVKCFEDNSLVRQALEEPGQGRVLVVDGGGSDRCALLGDNVAQLAVDNDWAGILVNGCIRDTVAIGEMPVPVKALAPHPLKSDKRDEGQRDVAVRFAGVTFEAGSYLYADADGVIISPRELSL